MDGVKTGRYGVKREVSSVIAFLAKSQGKPFRGYSVSLGVVKGDGRSIWDVWWSW